MTSVGVATKIKNFMNPAMEIESAIIVMTEEKRLEGEQSRQRGGSKRKTNKKIRMPSM